jgi:hypothetical protein
MVVADLKEYPLNLIVLPWSLISNGREPSSCLGRIFNSKLGSFVSKQRNCTARTQLLLELKIRPRFCPVSCSLSIFLRHCDNTYNDFIYNDFT